jgi:hypothetical protein
MASKRIKLGKHSFSIVVDEVPSLYTNSLYKIHDALYDGRFQRTDGIDSTIVVFTDTFIAEMLPRLPVLHEDLMIKSLKHFKGERIDKALPHAILNSIVDLIKFWFNQRMLFLAENKWLSTKILPILKEPDLEPYLCGPMLGRK